MRPWVLPFLGADSRCMNRTCRRICSADRTAGSFRSAGRFDTGNRTTGRRGRLVCHLPRLVRNAPGPMSPRRSTTKRLAHAGLASGLALFTALIAWEGVREVARTLASAGMGLVWVTLFHLAPLTASALGWYALFGATTRPPFRTFAWGRWIAESINQLLPALHVGGNIVRAQLLARRGVPGPVAGASVVVDITL